MSKKNFQVNYHSSHMASSSSSSRVTIHPGPVDEDVLWAQKFHISQHAWNDTEPRKLQIRRAVPTYQGRHTIPPQIIPILEQTGFYGVCSMAYINIDSALIQAFIERWRPETHTFHMRFGELTITLQDVAMLIGLPVNGLPIFGPVTADWEDMVEACLGFRPEVDDMHGSTLKFKYFNRHFSDITPYLGSIEDLHRFTRAWILRFLGGVIFVDKNSTRVHLKFLPLLADLSQTRNYSWGGAALAYLYREMCNATNVNVNSIGGMVLLIQLWAWERFRCVSPRVIPQPLNQRPLSHRYFYML